MVRSEYGGAIRWRLDLPDLFSIVYANSHFVKATFLPSYGAIPTYTTPSKIQRALCLLQDREEKKR